MSRFLNEKQVALLLAVSVRTLQHWRLVGQGPLYQKFGRSVRYDEHDIEEFAAQTKCPGKARDALRASPVIAGSDAASTPSEQEAASV